MKYIVFITTVSLSLLSLNVGAVKITNVLHGYVASDKVEIKFNLSEAADVSVNIYDDRDYLVRSLAKGGMDEGDQIIVWDLRDKEEVIVPPEAYKYTISATSASGEKIVHDLSDLTGNKIVTINDAHLNKKTGNVEFVLTKPSRVHIRAGLSGGGPLLVTIANWVARTDGLNVINWDGHDASKVINIKKHAELYFSAQAYSFSNNTIIVGNNSEVELIDMSTWDVEKREKTRHEKKVMVAAYQQSPGTRGDFVVNLDILKKGEEKNKIPVVSGIVPVRLDIKKENRPTIFNRRAEPVFYIDGKFSYENEVGFYPMIWKLDTRNLNAGEHYLTVNLRGYEGNFGIASKKIIVEHVK